ncbi:MAG: mannitol dehydrogenase family protein [Paraglaciecola sp.]|nr:mannitol dehydrogenase family protein [Paraglaciecola sp.]
MTTTQAFKRLNASVVEQLNLASKNTAQINTRKQIVHLGIGAFHRAHQAVYTQQSNWLTSDHWQIVGVSLRSATVRDQLMPQDGFYSVIETDVAGNTQSVISVIQKVLVAPESPADVLREMAKENSKIISLTITEKGYCQNPASGNLDLQHPDILHDLANLGAPKTAIGFLVSSLKERYELGMLPYTVLCCDNLPSNGFTLRNIVKQFAQLIDQGLADWIGDNVPFPNTMVDRIVPATTEQDIAELYEQAGYHDLAMVKTERFSQWVIEDKFAAGRPLWNKVGVSLVADVEPFENAKLRMLNGSHSSLAYLGYLMGFDYVHQVMQDKNLATYLKYLMQVEIMPTIEAPPGLDLIEYSNELLQRFSNPELNHRTYQIAMDGSQKMPQRLLHTIEDKLKQSAPFDGLCFAVAGWLRYTMAFDVKGEPIEVQDPLAKELSNIQKQDVYDIDKLIDGYLNFDKVFSSTLKNSPVFRKQLTHWLNLILVNGVETALIMLLETTGNQLSQSHD